MPDLDFAVIEADVLPYAALPTLLFKLRIANAVEGEPIHSILLRAQIRIEAARRHYDAEAEARLRELFGEPHRWGETLRGLLWTHTTAVIPGFTGNAVAELPITCTYDFDVTAAKYFHALEDGEVPLIFLFSGTVFYAHGGEGLRIAQIPWEKEAQFRLPIRIWKEMMDRYFPNSAWLRVHKDVFDRLYRYRTERSLPTWEDALEHLLHAAADREG
ncbi:MAG: hypothetical protein JO250_24270 [Armatimonadetes bacterium]|nr:hypothetical protein [Armatimonadota bacterium]